MKSISERPFFLAYDIVAGLGMIALAVYSALLAANPATRASRRSGVLMAVVTVVCGLRGGVDVVGDVVAEAQHQSLTTLTVLADFWFITATGMTAFLWRALTREPINSRL